MVIPTPARVNDIEQDMSLRSPTMAIDARNAPEKLTDTPMNPGDEAPPGTTGTGENICPDCAGTGRRDTAPCSTCNGTGKIIQGVGGA
jgi:hypothetical protein